MDDQPEISAGAWVNLDDATADHAIISKTTGGANFSFIVFFDDSNPAGTDRYDIFITMVGGTPDERASTTAGKVITGTWQFVLGRRIKNTLGGMDITVDGVQYTENAPTTTSDKNNIATTAKVMVGETDEPARDMEGKLAYGIAWNKYLSTNEVNALSHGVNPFVIRLADSQVFAPLHGNISPEPNWGAGSSTGIVTGTSKFAGNPPVQLLSRYMSGH